MAWDDDGLHWLASSLAWERSLTRLRRDDAQTTAGGETHQPVVELIGPATTTMGPPSRATRISCPPAVGVQVRDERVREGIRRSA